jgi:ABC-type branched-subunit amino acid transport system substrate-binding protein
MGERVLRSLQLALDDSGAAVELAVEDTAGDVDQAAAGVHRLAAEHHVVAILGPVGALESEAAAIAAEELGVPLVALSAKPGLANERPHVFQTRITPDDEAAALVQFALQDAGARRFAILSADNAYGDEMAAAFRAAVVRAGGDLVAEAAFDPATSDQRAAAKALAGGRKIHGKASPFDALFVPAPAAAARRVLPYLRAVGFEFRSAPDAARGVQVLGPMGWLDPELPDPAERNTENAVFPAAIDPDAFEGEAARFRARFQERYAVAPSGFEAEVYDAARLLLDRCADNLLAQGGRGELLARLAEGGSAVGVTGLIEPRGDGQTLRALELMTVHGDVLRKRLPLLEEVRVRQDATQGFGP